MSVPEIINFEHLRKSQLTIQTQPDLPPTKRFIAHELITAKFVTDGRHLIPIYILILCKLKAVPFCRWIVQVQTGNTYVLILHFPFYNMFKIHFGQFFKYTKYSTNIARAYVVCTKHNGN